MLTIRFDFSTGRFHATPWGSHVNEGAIEWPPSPWRFLRALLAVGFSRLSWAEVPDDARDLLLRLSARLPSYHLPPASSAHTRHYVPLYQGNPTKIIDTFAYVGADPLAMSWDVELPAPVLQLLDRLLDAMPYFGRAESAVIARRVDAPPPNLRECISSEVCPGPGMDRVALLAPELADTYHSWRGAVVARETEKMIAEAGVKALEKGKKPQKSISKKDQERLDEVYPRDLIDVLLVSTKLLQANGWSQPPGSRWVSYWRPVGALRAQPVRRASTVSRALPTTALLALASDTKGGTSLPPITDALWRMEALHDALVSDFATQGQPSLVFVGKENGAPLKGHRHASLIPLTLGRRADRIDHVLVHAPMGFDAAAQRALRAVTRTYAKDLPTIFVTLAGMGALKDFEELVPCVRESSVWSSRTPFVVPRHPKTHGKDTLIGQLQAELVNRGLPPAERIEPLEGTVEHFRRFRRERRDLQKKPPVALGHGVRLVFAAPVSGPVSLGYGSHFGLGCFDPG
ncbi:hypothetical protein BH09MYX1_BH09MYX1_36730 [soil metagenome]